MFSLLELVKVFAVFVEFGVDNVLAMVEPDIELLGT
jgi:hypothetical protein